MSSSAGATDWNRRPDLDEVSAMVARVEEAGRIGAVDVGDGRAVVLHDLDRQDRRLAALTQLFPDDTLHAVAVKANPLVEVLRPLVESGAGCETASIEEIHVALAAGCPPDRIVFDSPAKTLDELAFALERGLVVNVDNPVELERVAALGESSSSVIGVRLNPDVGSGTIGTTSVGGRGSRFGAPADQVVEMFATHAADLAGLRGLHVHVGSQGCSLDQLVAGARAAQSVREQIAERLGEDRIDQIDIGGGLPTDYGIDADAPTIERYVDELRRACPALFDGSVRLVTEFGRALLAGCGVAIATVEYTKRVDGVDHAIVHLGADLLLRTAYQPESWPYRFSVLDAEGNPKPGRAGEWTVAGPLCFAGDVIGRNVPLGDVEPGDRVVIHDVGAYTYSMWSRHCSRSMPAVIGVRDDAVTQLRAPERPEDIARMWSRDGWR
ncbi:MAG: diaminopimelate decarboxylase [Actinomycetota bacterium]